MSKIAAFFDIDGTIYREGLITEVFKKIIKYELIEEEVWHNEVKPVYLKWDRREGDYDDYLLKMVDAYKQAIQGLSKEHIDHISRKVIHQKGDRIYTFTRERMKWHKEQGHIVIAVSGSPIELVREMASKYHMDDFRGTIYQTDEEGKYNGNVIPMWDSESKQKALTELQEKYDIDMSQSFAYGDTTGDLTMFHAVGTPFAINPTKELITKLMQDEDLKQKMNVIVERKDVKYKLDIHRLELID